MEFSTARYKVISWTNWRMLHWIINPGLAINELIIGQRVPKVFVEDMSLDKPRIERTFVPCPHCETIHDSRTWSTRNGTGYRNWFGLYCPHCGGIIPCLTNATSFIILALTYPIWGWFKDSLKRKWLAKQASRFQDLDIESIPDPFAGKGWIREGLSWGLFMFILTAIIFPLVDGTDIRPIRVLLAVPLWVVGGLVFGFVVKGTMSKKGKGATGR